MRIDIDRTGAYRVSIQSDFTGAYINLDLSPAEAYGLLLALDAKRAELRDLAENYYDCPECGSTHAKSIHICPLLTEAQEE